MAAASGDGAVDQRDLVGHLLWRRAMRNEQPIGPTKSILKRMRLIEIDSGDAGTLGQLSRVGPPGQHGDIDRIGSEEAWSASSRRDLSRRLWRSAACATPVGFSWTCRSYSCILERSV